MTTQVVAAVRDCRVIGKPLWVVWGLVGVRIVVEPNEDRLRFIAGFVKQVRGDVKQQLEKEDESSKQAKQLLLKLKE